MAEVRQLHLKQAKMEEVNRTSADVKDIIKWGSSETVAYSPKKLKDTW